MASQTLIDIDGMIESTEEFLADEELGSEEHARRAEDLAALQRVRDLWLTAFEDASEPTVSMPAEAWHEVCFALVELVDNPSGNYSEAERNAATTALVAIEETLDALDRDG